MPELTETQYEISLIDTITNEEAGAMIAWFSSAVMCTFYFSQTYYAQYNNLVGRYDRGNSLYAYGQKALKDANLYTAWGIGQTINIWANIITNLISVILISLAGIHGWYMIHLTIMWAGWLRILHGIRLLVVGICKIISLFSAGLTTSYVSYSGLNKSYNVSIEHPVLFMDFVFEWGQFSAIYGLFPSLHAILDTFEAAVRAKQAS
jgi:hypothetical protein